MLDGVVGPSGLDGATDEPVRAHLDQLLGPARPVKEVLAALDEEYRRQGKPEIYFLALEEPIAPHLDALLGPMQEAPTEESPP